MSELELVTKTLAFATKSASDGTFAGYGSTWELDTDGEQMQEGCWADALKDGPVPLLFQHQKNSPCGWVFKADEDSRGLLITAKCLMDSEIGRTAFDFIKTGLGVGAAPNLSVGFRVVKDEVVNRVRRFIRCSLVELSIVTFGACPGAVAIDAKHRTTIQEREPDPLFDMAVHTLHRYREVEAEINDALRRIA